MTRRPPLAALLVLLIPSSAPVGELPEVAPEAVGLSGPRLAALKPELEKMVADGKIAGGVVVIGRHGKIAYSEPFGYRDLATKAAMPEDAIFAIASMTKPITCVAAMTLVERGKLRLDDPVSAYIPEMKGLRALGDPKDDTPEAPSSIPAARPITVRDLFTHTSGFTYGGMLSAEPRLTKAYDKAGLQGRTREKADGRGEIADIADGARRLAEVPLAHQPGERWTYGLSHDVLGRVIEVASGKRLDDYLKEAIFDPLDLRDTSFLVPEAKRGRVASVYRTGLFGGPLTPVPLGYGSATLHSGGGGLFSTARDYARFAEMLRGRGELGGVRVVKPETVAAMTSNQIGDLNALIVFKYGLGLGLEMGAGADGKPAASRYFWGGIFSTNFWVEPPTDTFAVVMVQVLPTNHGGVDRVVGKALKAAIRD